MSKQQMSWQLEADIIVAGYGSAGAVAAITAHDGDANVIVLEKQASENHMTTSFMAGGVIVCPNDVKGATRYMEALYKVDEGLYWTDPDIFPVWARYTSENKKWIESMGGKLSLNRKGGEHKVPGVEAIDVYLAGGMGPGLMRLLYGQVKSRDIQVIYNASATQLILNTKGEVVGVKAKQEGQTIHIRARRGVILATGGFEFDEQMKLQYLRAYPSYFLGSPANTGDGIRMALGAGAQLWHMNCTSGRLVMKFPEFPVAFNPIYGGKKWKTPSRSALPGGSGTKRQRSHQKAVAGYIIVDRSGKRYTNENIKSHTLYYELALFDSRKLLYPRIPSCWIFDQKRMDDGPLPALHSGPAGPSRLYQWSDNNRAELDRGWIKQGNTPKDLAGKIGLDPRTLEETVNNFNRYCKHGEDPECNRQLDTLIPLTTPPYYAVQLWPGGPNTQGGPRRNAKANVIRADGTEIPGLYSAGELGSIYGMLYPSGGGNLAECIAFGRIAGENASENRSL